MTKLNDFRLMSEIERIIVMEAGALKPRSKEKIESYKSEIRRMLDALPASSSPLDGNSEIESATPMAPGDSGNGATTSFTENGTSPATPPPILYLIAIVP